MCGARTRRHVEVERTAGKDKVKRRKARAKEEREQGAAHRPGSGQAGSSWLLVDLEQHPRASWPQGLPMTGDAVHARREAGKSASLEQAAEHSARLRQQEEERVQGALRRMEVIRLAQWIERGD